MDGKPPYALDTANLAYAGRLIRETARAALGSCVTFTGHAYEEMDADGLDELHALEALRGCRVDGLDLRGRNGEIRYRAFGSAVQEEANLPERQERVQIGAAVEIWEHGEGVRQLKVICVWKVEKRWTR